MVWCRHRGLPSRFGRKCKPLTCQETRFGSMAVEGPLTTRLFGFARGPWPGRECWPSFLGRLSQSTVLSFWR
eukprot:5294330-Amphidinium_carterae.1